MKTHSRRLGSIFAIPFILALLSLAGLVVALLGDGVWDGLGAGLLGVCLVMVLLARIRRRRG